MWEYSSDNGFYKVVAKGQSPDQVYVYNGDEAIKLLAHYWETMMEITASCHVCLQRGNASNYITSSVLAS